MATKQPPVQVTGDVLEKFSALERGVKQPAWLAPVRKAGLARYTELGLPTLRDEDWRFTNVAPIAKLPFKPVIEPAIDGVTAGALKQLAFAELPGTKLVFVNGHYAAALSHTAKLPTGIKVSNLAAALASEPTLLEKHLGRYAQSADNGFAALNQAFFVDGGFVYVPAGKTLEEPIQFIYVSTGKQNGAAIHPRNLVIAEANSQVTILESYVSLGGSG